MPVRPKHSIRPSSDGAELAGDNPALVELGDLAHEAVHARVIGGLHLVEWRHPPGGTYPHVVPTDPTLAIVRAGAFLERIVVQRRGVRALRELSVDALWCRPPGAEHANAIPTVGVPRSGVAVLTVRVAPDASAALRAALAAVEGPGIAARGATVRALGRRIRDELWRGDDLSALGVEASVAELVYTARRQAGDDTIGRRVPKGAPPPWLLRVRDRLRDECAVGDRSALTLDALAATEGVSPTTLARAFRRAFGAGPAAFVRECRLAWAVDALADPDRPVSEIAHAAGFADHSHFTRAFRAHFGVPPRVWRAEQALAGPRRAMPSIARGRRSNLDDDQPTADAE